MERCRKLMEKERERMKEVWERLRKEQTALLEAREKLSKLMTKGTTDIWRMKNAMAEQLKEYERMIAAAATEDDQAREARERMTKEQEQAMKGERPHSGRDAPSTACQGCGRQECRAATGATTGPTATSAGATPAEAAGWNPSILRSRDGVTLSGVLRAGAEATESQTLRPFSDSRMVKLLSTGGQMCLCLQLHTEDGVATWRQANVPNNGQSGVLLMPIRRTAPSDRSVLERQAAPVARRLGPVEMVLRGVSCEPEGRTRELILYTCQATGRQSVKYRYQTSGVELTARNEGVTLFRQEEEQSGAGGSGARQSEAEQESGPDKDGQPRGQDRKE